jgi:hypothetical protein
LSAGVILDAHARRLQPAAKAPEAMGQFHRVQREGLNLRAIPSDYVRQVAKKEGYVLVMKPAAIKDYDFFAGHAVSSSRTCYHSAAEPQLKIQNSKFKKA